MIIGYEVIGSPDYEVIGSPVRHNFCKFFSSVKKWRRLTHFSIKNLLCILLLFVKKVG